MEIVEVLKWTEESEEQIKGMLTEGKTVAILCDAPLVAEIELKKIDNGILVGPSCSFSLIGGVGVGIWNDVKRGPVGLIGSSSSGLRALACLLSKVGISHALHVGWRDFSQAVGALSTKKALRFLQEDPHTEHIIVLGTFPNQHVVRKLRESEWDKPVTFFFLDYFSKDAQTLEDLAIKIAKEFGYNLEIEPSDDEISRLAEEEASKMAYGQKYVRGIFSGKFLCVDAQLVLMQSGKTVYSNVPLRPRLRLPDLSSSQGHTCLDISSPELSLGRSPPINPEVYAERIVREARDQQIGALVFDVVLGHGAHENPASVISEAVEKAKEICESTLGYLPVFASLIGTDKDPQNLRRQTRRLEQAGIIVASSTSRATKLAIKTAVMQ